MYKFEQVIQNLERNLEKHTLNDGDKLPSIRELAIQYGVNKSTIIRALHDLEERHLIYSVAKSGYYVVRARNQADFKKQEIIDFVSAAPDPGVFPYLDFQHCINKAIDTYKNDLFIYGTSQGLPSLLALMQRHLANYQVFTQLSNIFIVSGVQQALSILCTMPFPNRKRMILIEQPCYHLLVEHLQTHQLPVMGIRRTEQGIDMDELERIFRTEDIKFFYTIPRFHNPLGSSYRTEERKRIAALARKYDVYIVEDDYLADLEHNPKSDPLYAYDQSGHVIYLKSYSKIIFPGLRIGVAVIPDALIQTFNRYKRTQDIDSSMLSQGALEIYLKSGMFEHHREKIRTSYARRSQLMQEVLRDISLQQHEHFAIPSASSHLTVHTHLELHDRLPVQRLISDAQKKSIHLESIDKHYLASFPASNLLKINVTNVPEDRIELGLCQLIEIVSTIQFNKG
ncbi:PLP-dependent aminotransferase family protein [Paenibacillus alvei]|uniref:aminotransferase-like domain-containing protein n=1 Tax=Paenibacillus alvei TaxID=44250 RepID=UPI00227FBAA0|nr:PLP-dependent aminotransferase family protein [Paenibacillus alvei]